MLEVMEGVFNHHHQTTHTQRQKHTTDLLQSVNRVCGCVCSSLIPVSPLQVPWSTGTECVAKYNFQTANDQDLPFCKGDVLTIIGVTRVRSGL